MKKITLISILFFVFSLQVLKAQVAEEVMWENVKAGDQVELTVFYHENSPFVYQEKGKLTGIEIDILNSFVEWVKENKEIEIELVYQKPQSFYKLLLQAQNGRANTIGLGTITITEEREKNLSFSAPYLRNVSVLLSQGSIKTALSEEDLKSSFGDLYPVTVPGSIHEDHIKEFRERIGKVDRPIKEVTTPKEVIESIAQTGKLYGYSDVITFWQYMKEHDDFIKMHKVANKKDEFFGFAFPKESSWKFVFDEFLESGFGFTATKAYHRILEKHLGYEIINTVEID